ncbi:MAG: UDP-N-acetylmuramoyl-tripeptide--D-alanyl-D-alanine ligase [Proteobacteria bacterium]|nr:UDP-N-acetylmuramoyl-tripeptide--D-alanyl-D-alanine ligase [Pseudomonadota bacterium]
MSAPLSAEDVLRFTGARLLAGAANAHFCGTEIDTRRVGPGFLFVAIRGERHDAHDFLDAAVAAGATGLLVESAARTAWPEGASVFGVDDTTRALGCLAAGHRRGFEGPLVAITGSNGKTTTKEMTASILGLHQPCLANEGNLNNHFGLPLTLLRREPEHQSAVVELGMNHRGEIAPLTEIAAPTVGVLTNVGTAHIEYLGSREEIAAEKGDLLAGLEATATAVVNRDDALAWAQTERTRARVIGFGRGREAQVRAEEVRFEASGAYSFELESSQGRALVRVTGLAETTVLNAVAAAAAALAAGASLADVTAGLGRFEGVKGRMQVVPIGRGTVIDDTYNANPQSMEVALRTLARLGRNGRAIAIVGDMGELGASAEAAHRELGRLGAALELSSLWAVGPRGVDVVAGAVDAGMPPGRVHALDSHEEAATRVGDSLRPGDWVLVKGSRAMQMERVVAHLTPEEER